jgi:D-glycero-alpha-D-manno-heptose-7-phosphate kinase
MSVREALGSRRKTTMKACARAPVRVDPAGGGTDAPPYCIEHGGAVVNFAVERHVYASAQKLPLGSGVIICSADLCAGATALRVSDFAGQTDLEFLKAFVLRLVPDEDSLLLLTESDVQPDSGLGGSGALGVAIVAAIDGAYGRSRSPAEIAALANDIERSDLGYPGGNQDSYAAALGDVNFLQYHRGGGLTPRRIQLSSQTRRILEHHSLLIYTGGAHVSGSIHEDIKRAYLAGNPQTMSALTALHSQAETTAAALEAGNLTGYAAALQESCRQLYNLHAGCDSPDHRRYFQALADLIVAGKTCGAGGGGFLLVLTRPGRRSDCTRRAEEMGAVVWPVTIDTCGVSTWLEPPFDAAEIEQFRQAAYRNELGIGG